MDGFGAPDRIVAEHGARAVALRVELLRAAVAVPRAPPAAVVRPATRRISPKRRGIRRPTALAVGAALQGLVLYEPSATASLYTAALDEWRKPRRWPSLLYWAPFASEASLAMTATEPIMGQHRVTSFSLASLLFIGFVLLDSSRAWACDCSLERRFLPPDKTTDGQPFLAPLNTRAWVIESVRRGAPARIYFVQRHGAPSEEPPLGTGLPARPLERRQDDCRLSFEYRIVEIVLPLLEPWHRYDIHQTTDDGAPVVASFSTGEHVDQVPPRLGSKIACVTHDGAPPAGPSCKLNLPTIEVNYELLQDDSAPVLFRTRVGDEFKHYAESSWEPPLRPSAPGKLLLSSGNVCEGSTAAVPRPFTRATVEVAAVDLSGNQSETRRCAVEGPMTIDVSQALERLGKTPPRKCVSETSPTTNAPVTAERADGARVGWLLLLGVAAISVALNVAFVVLRRKRR